MASGSNWLTRFALLALAAGLAGAYTLGALRSGDLGRTVEQVRGHESRLAEHDRRLDGHERRLEGHEAALHTHEKVLESQADGIAAARKAAEDAQGRAKDLDKETAALREELEGLKREIGARDAAYGKLVERIERLERALAGRAP